MQKYSEYLTTQRKDGAIVPLGGAIVSVTTAAGVPITLYSDDGITQTANPLTASDLGMVEFYAADGNYTITITKDGTEPIVLKNVPISTGVTEASLASAPAYRQVTGDQALSGRQRTLVDFAFASVYGNGVVYPAATIQAQYATGIGTGTSAVLNRATDENIVGTTTSRIPAQDRAVWELSLLPTHVMTIHRPRTQIVGKPLKFNTPYRMSLSFKLKQPDAIGWNNRTAGVFDSILFAVSQQDGDGTAAYSEGQRGDAASPIYIKIRGGYIFPDLRVIGEELGLFPGDPDAVVNWPQWDSGDWLSSSFYLNPFRALSGHRYHSIEIFFSLDERRGKDGGKGYVHAFFDGQPWFRFNGMSSLPKNQYGNSISCHSRLGFYETITGNGALYDDGVSVSTVPSTSIARVLRIKHYSIVEVKA